MHVNPTLNTKALVMLFNPLKEKITRRITLPLYYTGLSNKATLILNGKPTTYILNRSYEITVNIDLLPESYTWCLLQ
jgi:hypothetical protein